MPDTHCRICNEPWDIYGLSHGDVKAWEADMIRAGIGCPSCNNTYKPKEYKAIICQCIKCSKQLNVHIDDILYDGSRKVIYDNLGLIDIELDKIRYAKSFGWKFIDDNELLCDDCFIELYTTCIDCDHICEIDDTIYINDHGSVCTEYYKYYSHCHECEEDCYEDETTFFENKILCDSCLKKLTFECEICDDRCFKDNVINGPNDEMCCSERCADKCEVKNDD